MPSVRIIHRLHDASLKYNKGLSFSDFDKFVRQRFSIAERAVITFSTEDGDEIIPCFSGKSNQVIIVTSKSESPEGSHAGGKECHNPVSDSVGGGVVIIWNIFIGLVPAFLLLSIAYSLRGLLINRGPVGAEVAMFDILRYNWIHFQQECDLTEVWIGFIAWSFTNLFIRRLLNPEIGLSAFEKYGGDSIFGGFSAACTVLLKAVLKKSLKDLQSGI